MEIKLRVSKVDAAYLTVYEGKDLLMLAPRRRQATEFSHGGIEWMTLASVLLMMRQWRARQDKGERRGKSATQKQATHQIEVAWLGGGWRHRRNLKYIWKDISFILVVVETPSCLFACLNPCRKQPGRKVKMTPTEMLATEKSSLSVSNNGNRSNASSHFQHRQMQSREIDSETTSFRSCQHF